MKRLWRYKVNIYCTNKCNYEAKKDNNFDKTNCSELITSIQNSIQIILAWFMVFNVTFNNNSVISWRSVLMAEETGVAGENYRPVTSHWQTLSHNFVSRTPRHDLYTNMWHTHLYKVWQLPSKIKYSANLNNKSDLSYAPSSLYRHIWQRRKWGNWF
jgi:hypothetical protein